MDILIQNVIMISMALDSLSNINSLLAMPVEYHIISRGNRKPLHEHFGPAIFPIIPDFDIVIEPISIQRLAKALIERDNYEHNLRYFYSFMPNIMNSDAMKKLESAGIDPCVVHETLIRFLMYDYACLQNYKMPYKRLMAEVGMGTPGALFKMIKVDKTFMVGPYGSSLIIKKQHEADWAFFEKLGEAVQQKPVDEPEYLFKAKLICAYLWDTDLVGVSYPTMVEALEDAGVLARGSVDPRSFARMLNRHGLKRHPHNRKCDISD